MSTGVKGGVSKMVRASIQSSLKKTIENIKEITGQNHSDDEIYAMLKECSMDPNEAAQKLLLLDTFHEVKKKRDKRKENLNKEPTESKWKPDTQAQANTAGRRNYQSQCISYESGGGRSLAPFKESATTPLLEKGTGKDSLSVGQEMKKNVASPVTPVANSLCGTASRISNIVHDNHASANGVVNQPNSVGYASMIKFKGPVQLPSPVDSITNSNVLGGTSDVQNQQMVDSNKNTTPVLSAPALGSYLSSSDPILLLSQDLPLHSAVGPIRCAVESQHTSTENSHVSDTQQVIIPDHVHVPESEKLGFCFGSFDATFGLNTNHKGIPVSSKSPESEAFDKPVNELQFRNKKVSVDAEETETKFHEQPQSPSQGPENFPSIVVEVSASITSDSSDAKNELQSSIPPHQPLPVFQQPDGLHLPHYPPNFFMPYGPYFFSFYPPPPAFHQFITNGAFSQQPQAGNLYPIPTSPGTTAKNPVSQLKQGSNSMADENLAAPQEKENNNYVCGTESQGTGVRFINPPSPDISTMHASSFYNLPLGQQAFTPTQPAHGTFTGIFHPPPVDPLLQQSQSIKTPADNIVGPTPSVYNIEETGHFFATTGEKMTKLSVN